MAGSAETSLLLGPCTAPGKGQGVHSKWSLKRKSCSKSCTGAHSSGQRGAFPRQAIPALSMPCLTHSLHIPSCCCCSSSCLSEGSVVPRTDTRINMSMWSRPKLYKARKSFRGTKLLTTILINNYA